MNISKTALLLALFVLTFSACSSDTKDNTGTVLVDPDPPDDPSDPISYSTQVQPIFSASCSGSGCHIGSSTSGVSLGSHASVLASRGTQYGGLIVFPGNSSGSPIIDKVGNSPDFGSRMPLTGSLLSSAQISTIAAWIDEGAQNN